MSFPEISFPENWAARTVSAVLAAALLIVATGCGFRPLYGENTGGTSPKLATIYLEPIADRAGQMLHNRLRDRLNPNGQPARPLYSLSIRLTETRIALGVRKDEFATRANLTVRAKFALATYVEEEALLSGVSVSTNSFDILDSHFATLSAENDARRRAVREISDDIKTRLAIFLGQAR